MGDIQCIFCKYKNDEDKCFDMLHNHGYDCPSLSNIFYGKIIKLPIIKQIYGLCRRGYDYYLSKKFEEEYIDEYETEYVKFIWGTKSYDDLSSSDANLYTMNDIDLIYLKDKNKYAFGLETIYDFDDEEYKMDYLERCLDAFTNFMNENGYDTGIKPHWGDVFRNGINTEFDSIEECYAMFRLLVHGYFNY